MNVTEANHMVKLLRHLLDPEAGVPAEAAADAVEYLAGRAGKTLLAGLQPERARTLFESYAERRRGEANWNEAIDWLLNSSHVEAETRAAFWAISDGWATREQATAGHIDGISLLTISNYRDELA